MSYKKLLFGFLILFVFVLAIFVQPSQTSYAAGTVPTKKPTSKSGSNNTAVPSSTGAVNNPTANVGTPIYATLISVKTLTPTGQQGQRSAAATKKPTKTKVPTHTKTPTRTTSPTITNTPQPATATSTETEIVAGAASSTPTSTPTITLVPANTNLLSIIPTEYIRYIYMFCGLLIILAIILIIFLILRRGKQQNNEATTPPTDSTPPAQ